MSSTSAAEPAPEFVDTNVLLYGHDVASVAKQRAAMRLLDDLWARRAGCLSLQVLQEFYVSVTGKLSTAAGAGGCGRPSRCRLPSGNSTFPTRAT